MPQPTVWHHGLMAREWAEFETDLGEEGTYFQGLVEAFGQPALDLGCGTGRLLVPFLQAGLDVDGCELSADMLAQCRARAEKAGLSPRLYRQAMHELDLPRRYRTIFACGVIGLGGERQLTRQGMRRCYEHLRPGGVFVFDVTARWNDPPAWLSRLPKHRQTLPDPWGTPRKRKRLADGSELELTVRTVAVDPLAEAQTRQVRLRLYRDGELLEEEVHSQRYEEYGRNELVLVLELAGFRDIQILGDYTDQSATSDHRNLVFLARKE